MRLDQGITAEIGMECQRPKPKRLALHRNTAQFGNAGNVYQRAWFRKTERKRRLKGLAASDDLGGASMRLQG
jgi:hypothetical protein